MEEKSTGRGFLILSFANIAGKILSMVYTIILINILGEFGQGIHTASYSVYVFLLAVTSMGAQPAITKVITELRALGNHQDAFRAMGIARRYLAIFGGLISLGLMAFAQPIANAINNPNAAYGIMALAPAIFFVAVLTAERAYLQSIEDMKSLAISQLMEQLTNIIINVSCAFSIMTLTGNTAFAVAGATIGATVGAAGTLAYVFYVFKTNRYKQEAFSHPKPKKRVSEKKIIKKLIKYGIPITLVAALQNAGGIIDSWNVVSRLEFAGFTNEVAVGMYGILGRYMTLVYVPLAIVTALGVATFPKIIQAFVQKSKKDIKIHMNYAFRLTYIITIPATVGFAILSSEIYKFLFGKDEGHQLLMYGSTVLVFMAITQIQNTVLQGVNKQYVILGTAGLGLLLKFILNYVLIGITDINILGAVVSNIVAFGVPMIINHRTLQKTFRVKIPMMRQCIVPLLCSGVMAGTIYFLKYPALRLINIIGGGRLAFGALVCILALIGGTIYLVTMIYTGGIRRKDMDSIHPKVFSMLPRFLRKQII